MVLTEAKDIEECANTLAKSVAYCELTKQQVQVR